MAIGKSANGIREPILFSWSSAFLQYNVVKERTVFTSYVPETPSIAADVALDA